MKLQKIASLILALVMIFSLGITAFAEDGPITSGTIQNTRGSVTVNSVSNDATYTIYRLLTLESFDITSGAHSYKVDPTWKGFFELPETLEHITIDAQGYVTWVGSEADSVVAAFAQSALEYAKEKGIEPIKSSANPNEFVVNESTGSGVFSDLTLGWYLVDTNVGALCGLTTTNPNASVNAKNGRPTVEKQVQEDSTNNWGTHNTADIGQLITFRTTIYAAAGAQNYVLHDEMGAGFDFIEVTYVELVDKDGTKTVDPEGKYEVSTVNDGCTFEVIFSEAFCDELEANDKVIVYYTATLNEEAVIGGAGNINTSWATYGENEPEEEPFKTEKSATTSYTYGFDIIKTDAANKLIDGAEFVIYDAETEGNVVKVEKTEDGYIHTLDAGETNNIIVANGKVRVYGLDNGTYYLEEVVTPEGYNTLPARQKFIINNANLDATFNEGVFSSGSGVHVVNKTGAMLPETGGIGTTMFYVIGGILVAGSIVFLVTKKRMSDR